LVSGEAHATIAIAGVAGNAVRITSANSPYKVSAASGATNANAFQRFLANWAWIFQPPASNPVSLEARGITPMPTHFTPTVDQKIRAGRAQAFPIVWVGPTVTVTISGAGYGPCSGSADTSNANQPRFALMNCPSFATGTYRLTVGEVQPIQINVIAVQTTEPTGSANEQALAAADTLKYRPEGRLQALADLERLSDHSYYALAILNAVKTSP
jgi:hypothetical protein